MVQVRDFLHPEGARRAPQHWWCKPPPMLDKPAAKAAAAPAGLKATVAISKGAHTPNVQPAKASRPASRPTTAAAAAAPSNVTASLVDQPAVEQPAAAANDKCPKKKQKQQTTKAKSVRKADPAANHVELEQSGILVREATSAQEAVSIPAVPSSLELQLGTTPVSAGLAVPGPTRQSKPAASRKHASQGVGGVSAFSARALSELMEDGPLLEAVQDLLTALQAQDAPSSSIPHTADRVTVSVPTTASSSHADSSHLPADAKVHVAATPEPAGPVIAANGAGLSTTGNATQHVNEVGPAAVEAAHASGSVKAEDSSNEVEAAPRQLVPQASRSGRQDSKRLRGKAAVLAKALGLGTAGVIKGRSKASKLTVTGQSAGAHLFCLGYCACVTAA